MIGLTARQTTGGRTPYLSSPPAPDDRRLLVFAFPFAGGGATGLRQALRGLPDELAVHPVLLPGRETRFAEPGFTRLDDLMPPLLAALSPYLDRPFALLGCSMGAIIAYELACRLTKRGIAPAHLVAICRGSPRTRPNWSDEDEGSDEALLARVRALGGGGAAMLDHAEMRELMLPVLRADFALAGGFAWRGPAELDCPVTAIGGLGDSFVNPDALKDWAVVSTGRFRSHLMRGGHFFFQERPQDFADIVTRALLSP